MVKKNRINVLDVIKISRGKKKNTHTHTHTEIKEEVDVRKQKRNVYINHVLLLLL